MKKTKGEGVKKKLVPLKIVHVPHTVLASRVGKPHDELQLLAQSF